MEAILKEKPKTLELLNKAMTQQSRDRLDVYYFANLISEIDPENISSEMADRIRRAKGYIKNNKLAVIPNVPTY